MPWRGLTKFLQSTYAGVIQGKAPTDPGKDVYKDEPPWGRDLGRG